MKAVLNLESINIPTKEGAFPTTTCGGPWGLNQNPWDSENTQTFVYVFHLKK